MLTSFCVGPCSDPDQALLDVLMLPELYMLEQVLLVSLQHCNSQLCTARVIDDMCCANSTFSNHAAMTISDSNTRCVLVNGQQQAHCSLFDVFSKYTRCLPSFAGAH